MKGLNCVFDVTGEKTEYLLPWLNDKKVEIYGVKPKKNGLIIVIDDKDCKKLFAISRNMCYNIKRSGYKGYLAPIKIALSRIGLLIGGAVFVLSAYLCDGIITDVVYVGDAPLIKARVDEALVKNDLTLFSFADGDRIRSAEKALGEDESLSFASVNKRGRSLVVEVYLAKKQAEALNVKSECVRAAADGKIKRLVVLSGTPLVEVGDEVKKGQPIISAGYTHGEKTGETYALGEAEISCVYDFVYEGAGENEKIAARAKVLATEYLGDKDITSVTAEITEEDGKKICFVRVEYSVYS
ncbi:MAG: sporulation protein YqfD [Clostridia bacterium]|nr:sporulation protein YqfD [Clostridia bacterium]